MRIGEDRVRIGGKWKRRMGDRESRKDRKRFNEEWKEEGVGEKKVNHDKWEREV